MEDGQAEIVANPWCGLQQREVTVGRLFGEFEQLLFEAGQLRVVMADEGQIVLQGELAEGIGFLGQELFGPRLAVVNMLAGDGTVVGELMGLDAGEQFAAVPDVKDPLPQQGPQGPLLGGIDIGRRNQVGAEQMGDLFGVNAVVLVFAAVNGLEVEGVGQHELDAGLGTGIGQPIPAEHAFSANGQVVAIGRNPFEEERKVVVFDVGVDELLAVPVHDADIHLAGMEIDSAVELCGGGVILHGDHSLWGRKTPV